MASVIWQGYWLSSKFHWSCLPRQDCWLGYTVGCVGDSALEASRSADWGLWWFRLQAGLPGWVGGLAGGIPYCGNAAVKSSGCPNCWWGHRASAKNCSTH